MKSDKIKKILTVAICASLLAALMATGSGGRKKVRYFSPNNDGKMDDFVIPFKISDKRYVMEWRLIIENEAGEVVRTVGNKEALPSTLTAAQFFKLLVKPKRGVDIPTQVSWNGAMDNGETAPDGMYYYYFTAKDDNGNESKTDRYPVVIDTVPPLVDVTPPPEKIFGEGDKTSITIGQEGSTEDNWTGVIKNANGDVVRTYKWVNGAPAEFAWNGTNDSGAPCPDGVYSYEISAEDRAGNATSEVAVTNIIFSAEKPATSIALVGSKYFSPGTDSKRKDVRFDLSIPIPKPDSGNRLTQWSVKIMAAGSSLGGTGKNAPKILRTYDTKTFGAPPKNLSFDGKDNNGKVLPPGKYQAVVEASYLNGYVAALSKSGEFILDPIKPNANLSVSNKIFGAGAKTKTTISIVPDIGKKLAETRIWKARIYNVAKPKLDVQTFDFGQFPPDTLDWDGFGKNGKISEDGKYRLELVAEDLAGNVNTVNTSDFELNTKDATVFLGMSDTAFSPGTDSPKSTITFTPFAKNSEDVSEYTFIIKNAFDETVRTMHGTGPLPQNFVWDGKDDNGQICEDSTYTAALAITNINSSTGDTQTPEFTLDTKAPHIEGNIATLVFSPDGDGHNDSVAISTSKCTSENTWRAQIVDESGNPIKTFAWTGRVQTDGKTTISWDGTVDAGNVAPDGTYSIVFDSEDEAGNKFTSTIGSVTIDNRDTKAYLTAAHDAFSPKGTPNNQEFSTMLAVPDGLDNWALSVTDEKGNTVKSWKGKGDTVPSSTIWDGKADKGTLCEGTYTAHLQLKYTKGNEVSVASSPFICTSKPPELAVGTTPKRFSPDNDGTDDELYIKLSGKSAVKLQSWSFEIEDPHANKFWSTDGTSSITDTITWDGLSNIQKDKDGKAERVQSATDYPYKFTVTDSLGLTSTTRGTIPVDILVIKDGNLLKMAVPSIIFRSDNADFKTRDEVANGIDPEIAKNNERVLNRVAQVLNKFRDYKVTIVGHANRVTDNENEETDDNPRMWGPALIPLSAKRADFVKAYLRKKGVAASRMTTQGKGGTELVVDFHDKDNNWKNRRVEFILQK